MSINKPFNVGQLHRIALEAEANRNKFIIILKYNIHILSSHEHVLMYSLDEWIRDP